MKLAIVAECLVVLLLSSIAVVASRTETEAGTVSMPKTSSVSAKLSPLLLGQNGYGPA
jgi:hypothetical protein